MQLIISHCVLDEQILIKYASIQFIYVVLYLFILAMVIQYTLFVAFSVTDFFLTKSKLI